MHTASMHQTALDYLLAWNTRRSRKPLIIRGARQVGKSYLVRQHAAASFEHLLEINLEVEADAATLFASMSPSTIVPLLEARYGVPVEPGRTLLFLDEIQAQPELLSCLRYFHEQLPALHVIAAGSLLDFALGSREFSMPVGRIEYLHLGPISFEEFLLTTGKERLRQLLCSFEPGDMIPQAIHAELLRLTRHYMVLGGMPASVEAFVETGSHRESEAVRQSILSTFRDDFAKYGTRASRGRLDKLFTRVPLLVGKKFMYTQVDRDERSRELGQALQLLCKAGVAHRVRHTSATGIPLGAEASERHFKVLFLDVGLLMRACGLDAADVETAPNMMLVNAGAASEQFVGQHLLHGGEPYDEPTLYCWIRQKRSSNAEVDYLQAVGGTVVPVEVKAGKTGTLKSLQVFVRDKRRDLALRFNADLPSIHDARTSLASGKNRPFRLLSLPLYLVGRTRRLLRAVLV